MMRDPLSSDEHAQPPLRIETQIHRRRSAKAFGPMEAEWDCSHDQPPAQLRMVRPPPQHRHCQELTQEEPIARNGCADTDDAR